jgi:predicted dehydrogenase
MGRGHARAAAADPRVDLVALCDINPDRLSPYCTELEAQGFADHKKMLSTAKPDIVSVALPNHLHKPITIDALKAGAHVICEKPMAMNTREAERMLQVAEDAKRHLMINLSYRFTGEAQALKKVVDAGTVGDIYFSRTSWHRTRGIPGFGGWFSTKKLSGGGPLIDLGVHRIDLAMWLMGHPRPVTVSAATYDHIGKRLAKEQGKTFDVEDLGVAFIRFENGATMQLEISWAINCERRDEMTTWLYGTKAGLVHRNTEGYNFEALLFGEWNGQYVSSRLMHVPKPRNSMNHFIDVVVDGATPVVTAAEGVNVMRILDGIYKSAEKGKEIKV